MTYRKQDINAGTAYILWAFGFFGVCGVHRFYLGRIPSGLLYLFTFGLFGFGQFIDLLLIPGMARERNRYLSEKAALQQLSDFRQEKVVMYDRQDSREFNSIDRIEIKPEDPMLKLLKTAAAHHNVLSIGQAVIALELPVENVEKLLQQALKQGLAHIENDSETGAVRYYFDI
jgi:TM2 domain-containing membrane protein YozV